MLTLIPHQFNQLRENARKQYEDQLFALVLEEFPEKIALESKDKIKNDMKRYIVSALDLGIDQRGAAAIYVNLCFTLGFDLARHPDGAWSWDVLGSKKLSGQKKMEILKGRLAGEDFWEEQANV